MHHFPLKVQLFFEPDQLPALSKALEAVLGNSQASNGSCQSCKCKLKEHPHPVLRNYPFSTDIRASATANIDSNQRAGVVLAIIGRYP